MIVVAASDQNDSRASFSNYGATNVDLAAPGENILSTLPLSLASTLAYVQQASTIYSANQLTYSGMTTGITATIYNCGLGYSNKFPPAVNGNIALIQRGTLLFSDKVSNAAAAGGAPQSSTTTRMATSAARFNLPATGFPPFPFRRRMARRCSPRCLPRERPSTLPIRTKSIRDPDGTSMATPHVVGAAAFAAMNFPGESVTQRIQRILANVTPLASLQGVVKTGGRLNLARTVDSDMNGLPDWWNKPTSDG